MEEINLQNQNKKYFANPLSFPYLLFFIYSVSYIILGANSLDVFPLFILADFILFIVFPAHWLVYLFEDKIIISQTGSVAFFWGILAMTASVMLLNNKTRFKGIIIWAFLLGLSWISYVAYLVEWSFMGEEYVLVEDIISLAFHHPLRIVFISLLTITVYRMYKSFRLK